MEAIAARLPVVATRVGGVPELIRDRRSGIVVPPGDPSALADGMRAVMAMTPSEREAMTDCARAHLRESFEAEVMVERWEELLNGLSVGLP
jgi:glycosyltransferase involved in cell wall biosynthesis